MLRQMEYLILHSLIFVTNIHLRNILMILLSLLLVLDSFGRSAQTLEIPISGKRG